MAQVVEKAREKLRELEEEVEKLRLFLSVYEELEDDESVDKRIPNESRSSTEPLPEPHASPAEIVESARRLMREKGRPLTRSQLVMLLTERGLRLGGGDKNKNLGTVIWRSKQFDNIAGVGYWPKDFECWVGQRVREPDLLSS